MRQRNQSCCFLSHHYLNVYCVQLFCKIHARIKQIFVSQSTVDQSSYRDLYFGINFQVMTLICHPISGKGFFLFLMKEIDIIGVLR